MIHSFPFYISDWRDSDARMTFTPIEKLLYLELFIYCWKDGHLPNDLDALRMISGLREDDFAAAWPKVRTKFEERDGALHHWKVDEKREVLTAWRESRVMAGRKGGLARAQAIAKASAQAELEHVPKHMPKHMLKPSSSSSSSSNTPLTPHGGADGDFALSPAAPVAKRPADVPEDFPPFWALCPRKVGKEKALKAWRNLPATDRADAMAGMQRQAPRMAAKIATEGTDEHIPHPATWLNGRRWEDQDTPKRLVIPASLQPEPEPKRPWDEPGYWDRPENLIAPPPPPGTKGAW